LRFCLPFLATVCLAHASTVAAPGLKVLLGGGNASVTWNATASGRADLEHSSNLSGWTTVSANNTTGSFIHAVGNATRGFYRLRIQTAPPAAIGLSGDLVFGVVTVNETATRTLTISNSGTGILTVGGISFPD
jgi:hypothetical protein